MKNYLIQNTFGALDEKCCCIMPGEDFRILLSQERRWDAPVLLVIIAEIYGGGGGGPLISIPTII